MGPHVKRLMKHKSFLEKLSAVERRIYRSFVSVVEDFLTNHRVANFREIVEELVHYEYSFSKGFIVYL